VAALRIAIAILVAIVWAVVYLASVLNPDVSAPAELSGVMLGVVTWLFSGAMRESWRRQAREAAQRVLDATDERSSSEQPATGDA
jgi:membrane associated rhomboid family serine protease